MNNISFLRKPEDNIIRVGIVLTMMLTTIMPVEMRWSQSEVWVFYGIPAIFLWGFVILVWNRQKLHCTLTDIIAVVWFAYYVGRAWMGNEWPCRMEFLRTVQLFLMYVSLRMALQGTKMSALVLIGCILVFGCYDAWLGILQMYGDEISRNNLYALTGNFQNPGPYSAYLMIGVVVGLAALKDMSDKSIIAKIPNVRILGYFKDKMPTIVAESVKSVTWKHLVVAAITIMAIVLPATLSRAAFLGVAVVILLIYRDKYWSYRYIVWGTIALVGITFYFFKQGSADSRLIIWKAALFSWIDMPWFGVGIGGFKNAFAEGMSKLSTYNMDFSSAGVPDYAFNILLKIVTEQGVVGGCLAISLTAIAMVNLSRNSSPLFWGMVSLMVFAMFSYPFDLLPYKVIAVLIIAWSESKGERQKTKDQSQKTIGWIKVFLLSCFLSFASWQAGKIASESYQTDWNCYMPIEYNSYSIEDGYKWLSLENDNSRFLFSFGKKLRDEERYNESNAIFRQGAKCSADPMFYILMGNNYKETKHNDLAEKSYYKAFAVMPNRLLPFYQLMLLYKDSGDMKKATAMARRVIEMKPKIESRLTKEMKDKARDFLSQH